MEVLNGQIREGTEKTFLKLRATAKLSVAQTNYFYLTHSVRPKKRGGIEMNKDRDAVWTCSSSNNRPSRRAKGYYFTLTVLQHTLQVTNYCTSGYHKVKVYT